VCWRPACAGVVVVADALSPLVPFPCAAAAFRVVALRKASQIVAVATLRCVTQHSCVPQQACKSGFHAAHCTATCATAASHNMLAQLDAVLCCAVLCCPLAGCLGTSWLRCPLWPPVKASGGQVTAGGSSRCAALTGSRISLHNQLTLLCTLCT
jgi:hypothetical protein